MQRDDGNGIDALTERNRERLAALEKHLGYSFKDLRRLQQALVHKSFAFEHGGLQGRDNETLEFLGDAVLGLAVGFLLFQRYASMREGDLTRLRALLVNEGHLAKMAGAINLGEFLLLGKGEDASQGRQKPSILSSAYEAVVGAIYLDSGYEAALHLVERHFAAHIDERKEALLFADSKSRLQEVLQGKHGEAPVYILEEEEGPDHDKLFTVSVRFRDKVLAQGRAGNKKEAEQKAAAEALAGFDGS